MFSMDESFITRNDYEQLMGLIQSSTKSIPDPDRDSFRKGLKKAKKVDPRAIPPTYITMNTKVKLTDLGTSESVVYTLVFPDEADPRKGLISVLSQVGKEMLGSKIGKVVHCCNPDGERYLQIQSIIYQPEAAGEYSR
jgi:regulator of nucleoside diphosphate kinase